MSLDFPSVDYLDSLRYKLRVPHPFRPHDKKHTTSQRFILANRLRGFYVPDDAAKVAHDLVKNPTCKELIESMTLSHEPSAMIARMVQQHDHRCTVSAIDRYTSFYWDLSLVDTTEIRALLKMRIEYMVHKTGGDAVTPDERMQHAALKSAYYKDPRRVIGDLTVKPIASMLNRMRLGYLPSQVELARLAEAARVAATARSFESCLTISQGAAAEARDFAVVARVMTELLNEIGSPDAALREELQQLSLATNKTRPPMLSELSGGNHTIDLHPAVGAEVVDGEE